LQREGRGKVFAPPRQIGIVDFCLAKEGKRVPWGRNKKKKGKMKPAVWESGLIEVKDQ